RDRPAVLYGRKSPFAKDTLVTKLWYTDNAECISSALSIDCQTVSGKSRGHNKYAARLEITIPASVKAPNRHCRAANRTTTSTAKFGFTSAASTTMVPASPQR